MLAYHVGDLGEPGDAVAHEEHLPVAAHLEIDGIGNHLMAVGAQLGVDGVTVGRWRAHDAHVSRSHERELQGAGNGCGRHGDGVDIGFQLAQLLLGAHAKLMLLVDDEHSEVVPLHGLAQELVRADDDIDLSARQVFQHLLGLLGRPCPGEIVHTHGKILEAVAEGLVMLKGEHRGGHEHGHLLGVAGRLECRPDSHLGLSEAHIAADEAVHRLCPLHVGLHVLGGFELVGGVFVEETGLQLVLHEAVGTICEAFLVPTLGVEADEIAGDILDALLRFLLQPLPCPRAERAQARRLTGVAATIFGDLIERMDGHIHLVVVLVDDADDLLVLGVGGRLGNSGGLNGYPYQSAKLADAEVYVHDEVARLHLLQLFHGEGNLSGPCAV